MTDYNINARWCRVICETLSGLGVKHAVLCPGGRSAAMAIALSRHEEITCEVQTDERSAAFIALGIAKTTRCPCLVVTTSGSAIANLLPALTEADASNIPLVVLSCDRPFYQRNCGVPQTIDQLGACSAFVRHAIDLHDPEDSLDALNTLSSSITDMFAQYPNGPLQINIPLLAKLCTTEIDDSWQQADISQLKIHTHTNKNNENLINDFQKKESEKLTQIIDKLELRSGMKGLIIASADSPLSVEQVKTLARYTGYPILADAPSQLRQAGISEVISNADALVISPAFTSEAAQIILRLGPAPVSHTMQNFLGAQTCPILRIDTTVVSNDYLHEQFELLQSPSDLTLQTLANTLEYGDKTWRRRLLELSARLQDRKDDYLAALPWGDVKAASVVCQAKGFDFIHLANSMSIRHGNMYLDNRSDFASIFANRGVNGIDGTIATFLGELHGSEQQGLLLIGDQTAVHDVGALEFAGKSHLNGCIVILNNRGGAIFDMLDCARLPEYEHIIRHPNTVKFERIAQAFGLGYKHCASEEHLQDALSWSSQSTGIQLIEADISRKSLRDEFRGLYIHMIS